MSGDRKPLGDCNSLPCAFLPLPYCSNNQTRNMSLEAPKQRTWYPWKPVRFFVSSLLPSFPFPSLPFPSLPFSSLPSCCFNFLLMLSFFLILRKKSLSLRFFFDTSPEKKIKVEVPRQLPCISKKTCLAFWVPGRSS